MNTNLKGQLRILPVIVYRLCRGHFLRGIEEKERNVKIGNLKEGN
jgi:hypothetical protein